jgi:hypothetical protein
MAILVELGPVVEADVWSDQGRAWSDPANGSIVINNYNHPVQPVKPAGSISLP